MKERTTIFAKATETATVCEVRKNVRGDRSQSSQLDVFVFKKERNRKEDGDHFHTVTCRCGTEREHTETASRHKAMMPNRVNVHVHIQASVFTSTEFNLGLRPTYGNLFRLHPIDLATPLGVACEQQERRM